MHHKLLANLQMCQCTDLDVGLFLLSTGYQCRSFGHPIQIRYQNLFSDPSSWI
jgi:hypothetical protein